VLSDFSAKGVDIGREPSEPNDLSAALNWRRLIAEKRLRAPASNI
jgi:hypothetical protein